ncbi:unnamed protein product [Thlaspi arvense]|uniref:ADP-ribosyl cyclase/cyclic ADP-ribose hydrolase n=1 Tax=Thlaspi arvense TaxID=13288 RepID=A0AAU9R501_THLAR|nr:unnamed protein product [Thlaspi arvense]
MAKTGSVSDPRSRLKWDIFLSFQRNTRHSFTERLYEALIKEQVRVWNGDAERGSHEEAMEGSVVFVVVLSLDYAKSHWCLEELAKLCDLESSLGHRILPIFYGVDPWHFRRPSPIEEDFKEHSKIFGDEEIQRWRRALRLVGNISGFVLSQRNVTLRVVLIDYGTWKLCGVFRYDVFLSFRGGDTRDGFADRLYKALKKEVRVFRDNEGMERGTEIAQSLEEGMADSAASVVVLSRRYADSRWCLNELAMLCDLESSLDRPILPIFYKVNPSHVRKQSHRFEKHFDEHAKRFSEEEVQRWRGAMSLVGNLAGYVHQENSVDEDDNIIDDKQRKDEDDVIERVVKKVLAQVSNTPEKVGEFTVGLESRVDDLMKLVDFKSSSGVQILGLYGMGGIGKTTLAKRFYNKIIKNFEEHRVFISDVREKSSRQDGLVNLQTTLITELSPRSPPPIEDVSSGRDKIRASVHEKKVLAVLDDVDSVDQINALVGERSWYGQGSLIIVTTRDEEILRKLSVDKQYEVSCLTETQALNLFSYHSLRKEKPTESLMELSKKIVQITGRLPLAVEVFGSLLYDKKEKEWRVQLEKLKNIRPDDLQGVLALSFESLDDEEKIVFLDIACLFLKMEISKEEVVDVLKGCGLNAEAALGVLRQKSLVKILADRDNTLWMHDQIRDMGRQMVLKESLEDPGMRSRLGDRGEVMTVLNHMKGTASIRGMVFDFKKKFVRESSAVEIPSSKLQNNSGISSAFNRIKNIFVRCPEEEKPKHSEITIPVEPFVPMSKLRLLQINNVELEGNLKLLPSELKWIQWRGCPLETLPPDFLARQLAVLDLSESGIRQVQTSRSKRGDQNLKVVNLRGCHSLEAIPDLSNHKAIEKLVFEGCKLLVKVPRSVGNLSTLLHLDFRYCSNLSEFRVDVSGLKSLEKLFLSGCSNLSVLPENIGFMPCLKELLLDGTAIMNLPESIFRLQKLKKLSLDGCRYIQELPSDMETLTSLEELYLDGTSLKNLPNSIGSLVNLQKLHMMHCTSLSKVPDTINDLKSLKELFINGSAVEELPLNPGALPCLIEFSAGGCRSLKHVPSSIGGLKSLIQLQLDNTPIETLPEEIGHLPFIQTLELRNCKSLKFLPETIGGMDRLENLYLSGSNVEELPEDFGKLEKLVQLRMNKCAKLKKLPESFGDLKSLHQLYMEETLVTELPESFGNLSNLRVLKMLKRPLNRISENDAPGTSEEPRFVMPNSFSNLVKLEELDARSWGISGKIPDAFEKLSSLEILNLGNNYFHSLPSSLKGLSNLRELSLYDCRELTRLPPLPCKLEQINLANCFSLESIADLSELTILHDLNLTNCKKVNDIPGLEKLTALKRLYTSGCNSTCSIDVKKRLSKVSLKMLRNLSLPGNRIPDWFSQGPVTFSAQPNRELRGVVIAVVVAVNQGSKDDFQVPDVLGIQAQILELGRPKYNTTLSLSGVPRTSDDQLHICRYSHHHPMATLLKDGYTIQVIKQKLPIKQDAELKMHGIHLVYEGDDDLEGEEDTVNETHLSVSQKLANFFSSFEENEASSEGDSNYRTKSFVEWDNDEPEEVSVVEQLKEGDLDWGLSGLEACSVGSGDSGSGTNIAIVVGKSTAAALKMRNPNDDWYSFREFLSNRLSPLTLSGCNAKDAIDFLREQQISGDSKVLVGRLIAACDAFGIKTKDNPFRSLAVTTYLKEARQMTREAECVVVFSCNDNLHVDEAHFIEAILKELHKREVSPLTYNLSRRENVDVEMLYRSSVGIMVVSNSFARSSQSLDHLVAIMELRKATGLEIIPAYFKVTRADICGLEGRFEAEFLQYQNSVQADRVQKWRAAIIEAAFTDGNEWTKGTQFMLAEEVVINACSRLHFENSNNLVRILALLNHPQPSDVEIEGIWGMAGIDDVSNARDAEYVVGGFGWFSRGHRIILTSRSKQVLVQSKVKGPYEIQKLCKLESSHLCKQYLNGERAVISELISCSSGIPLALKVLGSSVSKQHKINMKRHLQTLRKNPPTKIQEAFQRSFDRLDGNEKNIFLDLACFFIGKNRDHVVHLLNACGFFTSLGISNLIDESLVSLLENRIEIPIPYQDIGRFIVHKEDKNPCKRSRLWDSNDIADVLTKVSGTEAIEGIFLDASELTCKLSPTVFGKMYRLRLLKFYCSTPGNECKLYLPHGLDALPDELRLLHWENYPLEFLPQKFNPENLVEVNMPYSNMEKLWEGKKNLEKLKKIKLSHSRKLTDILMLSEALNLEHIDLEGCTSLIDVSTSISHLGKLVSLNMKDCSRLQNLPSIIDLTSLKLLNLSGCSELEDIRDFAPNLEEIYLAGSAIRELPLSIENLTELVTLDLEDCKRLQKLPMGIKSLKSIVELKLSGCTRTVVERFAVVRRLKVNEVFDFTSFLKRDSPQFRRCIIDVSRWLLLLLPHCWIPPTANSMWTRVIPSRLISLSPFAGKVSMPETEFLDHIAAATLRMLNDLSPCEIQGFPGIEARSKELEELLMFDNEEDVRTIGVLGMAGIGKTMVADIVYKRNYRQFDGYDFVDDVDKELEWHQLSHLREKLLCKVLERENLDVRAHGGMESYLSTKKLFIVLDNVTDKEQIDVLIGHQAFRKGTRILLITRDKKLLKGKANATYVVPKLNDREAMELFCLKAFPGNLYPPEEFMDLSNKFVDYSKGHPLALTLLGSDLVLKLEPYWKEKWEILKVMPDKEIQKMLEKSYEKLDGEQKSLFLDIACFFRSEKEDFVLSILKPDLVNVASVMRELEDKCLVTISYDRIEMHDLLHTMGKKIGYESIKMVGERSRLWNHKDIRYILEENTGTEFVRGIFFNMSNVERIKLSPAAFKRMSKLKFLKFQNSHCSQWCDNDCKFQFCQGLDHFKATLVYLHWQGYPYASLPSEFNPEELVDLNLRYSHIKRLWEEEKNTENLRWVDLSQSKALLNLSGLSKAKNLERLDLEGCTSLAALGPSIEQMDKLIYLNLRECTSLESLPEKINLKSLKTLILSGCSNLRDFQIISKNIESLYLEDSAIERVVEHIQSLSNLILLNLKNCRRLRDLPIDLYKLKSLQELIISGCSALESLPPIKEEMKCLEILLMDGTSIKQTPEMIYLSNLKIFSFCGSSNKDSAGVVLLPFSGSSHLSNLYLTNSNIYKLPDNFSSLHLLRCLCLSRNNIETLPESIKKLYSLMFLDLKHCCRLNSLPVLPSNLQYLDAHGCVSLEKVAKPLPVPLVTERMHTTYIFTDCFKLNRAEQEAIVSQAQLKSQLLARTALQHNHKGLVLDPLVAVCFPGSDLPSWFCHQRMGSSIETDLLPHWCNSKFIGASLCVVVTFKDHECHHANRLSVRCKSNFKNQSGRSISFSFCLGGWNESCGSSCHEPRKLGSDHVFISYNNCNVSAFQWSEESNEGNRCRPTSASFEFYLTDDTERKLECCKVIRCGMSLLYAPDENDRGSQGTRVTDNVERT